MTLQRILLAIAVSAMFFMAAPLRGQQGDLRFATPQHEIDPQLVPTSPATVVAVTVYINELTLTNESAADTTCIVVDVTNGRSILGSSAKPFPVAAGAVITAEWKGRKAPGGIVWSCAASAVSGYVMYSKGRY